MQEISPSNLPIPFADVPADLEGGERGPVGAPVQDRLSVERLGPDRTDPQHRLAAPDQEELQQEPERLLRRRVRW